MKILIAGKGQIGTSLGKIITEAFQGRDLDLEYVDPKLKEYPENLEFDIIHICFKCEETNKFGAEIDNLYNLYKPNAIIVNSTIPLYFDLDLDCFLYHWPIRGTHPNLEKGIKKYQNFLGPFNKRSELIAPYFFILETVLSNKFILLKSFKETALGKLINTSWYALQIAFCNQMKLICDDEQITFEQAYTQFMETDEIGRSYVITDQKDNCGKRSMAKELIPRPIMRPGAMGGHCLMPNNALLSDYAYNITNWIDDMHTEFKGRQYKQ